MGFESVDSFEEDTMKIGYLVMAAVLNMVLLAEVSPLSADTLRLKDGTKVEGIIKKVEAGNVFVSVGSISKTYNILDVENMDFNTPHLLSDVPDVTVEHFLKDTESQEVVRNLQLLDKKANEIQRLLTQIQTYWTAKEPIDAKSEASWTVAKETFHKPVVAYQEVLNDLYLHVLARVDEYNALMKEASRIYVGIKGVRVGSSLIPSELERLPLKKYVPGGWYSTIFYEGYNLGFSDGTQRTNAPKIHQ